MGKIRRKSRKPVGDGGTVVRFNPDRERWHWLDEGEQGQESLLLDIDSFLYAADGTICRLAGAAAYDDPGDPERPFALLLPPHDTVPWQQGVLGRRYRLSVWGSPDDPVSCAAADQFNVNLFAGDPPTVLEGRCTLVLVTEHRFDSPADLRRTVRLLDSCLAAGGSLIAVLRTEIRPEGVLALFRDEAVPVQSLLNDGFAPFTEAPEVITIPLHDVSRHGDDYLLAFLKRHREFFGRNMRDALLERMSEPDFTIGDRAGALAVTILRFTVPAED